MSEIIAAKPVEGEMMTGLSDRMRAYRDEVLSAPPPSKLVSPLKSARKEHFGGSTMIDSSYPDDDGYSYGESKHK